jgi:hypothetical protein
VPAMGKDTPAMLTVDPLDVYSPQRPAVLYFNPNLPVKSRRSRLLHDFHPITPRASDGPMACQARGTFYFSQQLIYNTTNLETVRVPGISAKVGGNS